MNTDQYGHLFLLLPAANVAAPNCAKGFPRRTSAFARKGFSETTVEDITNASRPRQGHF
jgi:hypothetical protein